MIRMRLMTLAVLMPVLALAAQAPKPSATLPPGPNPHLGNPDSLKGGSRCTASAVVTATVLTRAATADPI